MKENTFCYTWGALDTLRVANGRLVASGWVVSLEDKPVSELRVTVGGVSVGGGHEGFLPSPDVAAAWPTLPGTALCRFAIDAKVSSADLPTGGQGELISITPYVGSIPGVPLERVWPLVLWEASREESDLVGRGDFVEISFSFLAIFRLIASLQRNESILDAGCGLGRIAFSLGHYIDGSGRYEGFDISQELVEKARVRFSERNNFNFQHADIFNKMYNPEGRIQAANFRFPYGDGAFSFVFLTSVFTHMMAEDVRNYLVEIRRVLRNDGRCLATFFSIDDVAETEIAEGRSTIGFGHRLPDGCFITDVNVPEGAVAYREADLRKMIEDAGLKIAQIHRGHWPGRKRFLTYQDVFLLTPA